MRAAPTRPRLRSAEQTGALHWRLEVKRGESVCVRENEGEKENIDDRAKAINRASFQAHLQVSPRSLGASSTSSVNARTRCRTRQLGRASLHPQSSGEPRPQIRVCVRSSTGLGGNGCPDHAVVGAQRKEGFRTELGVRAAPRAAGLLPAPSLHHVTVDGDTESTLFLDGNGRAKKERRRTPTRWQTMTGVGPSIPIISLNRMD